MVEQTELRELIAAESMQEFHTLRELILYRLFEVVVERFDSTRHSGLLESKFHIDWCSKVYRGCPEKRSFKNTQERVKHWERHHPHLRLAVKDCAWVLAGGLMYRDTFESLYEHNLPLSVLDDNGLKSWTLEQFKSFINSIDLTEIGNKEAEVYKKLYAEAEINMVNFKSMLRVGLNISKPDNFIRVLEKPVVNFTVAPSIKINKWIEPIVNAKVPADLEISFEDAWEFVQIDENREWLAKVGIERPCQLFGYEAISPKYEWDALPAYEWDVEDEEYDEEEED